jgi:aminomethyltransferase
MAEPTKTPLHEKLESIGGSFADWDGWLWFEGLGDTIKEYEAVRNDVGIWDLAPLIKWEFTGPDATKAADWLNGNNVGGLKVGGVRYGPFLNADGAIVDDGTIYKLSEDHLFVMTNGEDHDEHWAENTKQFDVEIKNVARQMPHVAIQGPRSREVVQSLTDVDISGMKYFNFVPEKVTLGGATGYLARTGFSGELGYEFFYAPDQADKIWQSIYVDKNITPFGTSAIEILRLEAGLMVRGDDYEPEETNPFDVGLDRFIHWDKDFLGKSVIIGLRDNSANAYKTLQLQSLPEGGEAVLYQGAEVGVVSSGAAESPRFGCIAGARIAKSAAVDGTKVEVEEAEAIVATWSIYDPEKKKVRS